MQANSESWAHRQPKAKGGDRLSAGSVGRSDVDREPQPVRLEPAVELVEHDAGLDHAALPRDVELEHTVEMFRAVDDQRGVDGLT